MKKIGIIAEYNPFHNGHIYHIENIKTNHPDADIVCVMSGNFTQRGDIACINKYSRAKYAIQGGCDMVIELPIPYSISSAKYFALGAVKVLSKVKNLTEINFGSECGDINKLKHIANLTENSLELKQKMKTGASYAQSLEIINSEYDELNLPNNTLGVEYIRAISNLNLNINVSTIKRLGNDYCDTTLSAKFSSATAIRNNFSDKNIDLFIPNYIEKDLFNKVDKDLIFSLLKYKFVIDFQKNYLCCEGIENRINNALNKTNNYNDFFHSVTTKRYSTARIQRTILSLLLNIPYNVLEFDIPYINVLAINKEKKYLLSDINYPISTCKYSVDLKNNSSRLTMEYLKMQNNADKIYNTLTKSNFSSNILLV